MDSMMKRVLWNMTKVVFSVLAIIIALYILIGTIITTLQGQIFAIPSEDSVVAIDLTPITPPADDLFEAIYEFDDCNCEGLACESVVLTDDGDNNHNGSITNASSETLCKNGYFRPTITYDGSDSPYGSISFIDLCADGTCSVGAWVRLEPSFINDIYVFTEVDVVGANQEYIAFRVNAGRARLISENDAQDFLEISHGTQLNTDQWFFVTWVLNGFGQQAQIYVNAGTPATGTMLTSPISLDLTAIAAYNEDPPCCSFNGKLGALYLSKTNWSAQQVNDIFTTTSHNEVPESNDPVKETTSCNSFTPPFWTSINFSTIYIPFHVTAQNTQTGDACDPLEMDSLERNVVN